MLLIGTTQADALSQSKSAQRIYKASLKHMLTQAGMTSPPHQSLALSKRWLAQHQTAIWMLEYPKLDSAMQTRQKQH